MSITLTLAALALALTTARADVILIDPAGAPGDTLLSRAIEVAAPGDVILLSPGDYQKNSGTYVIDKGITILAGAGVPFVKLSPVQIMSVPDGQTVVLGGLLIVPLPNGSGPSLSVSGCRGTVWAQDCYVTGADGIPGDWPLTGSSGNEAAAVHGSHAIFRKCTLMGGKGGDAVGNLNSTPGGNAIRVAGAATVFVHQGALLGGAMGNGPASDFVPGGVAGNALLVASADVTLSGCALIGGGEGADNDAQPGTSGSAVVVTSPRGLVRVLSSTLDAGYVQGSGSKGPGVISPPAAVQLLSEPSRDLWVSSLVREGQTAYLMIDGEPGDMAFVLSSTEAAALPMQRLEGTLALHPQSLASPLAVGVLTAPSGQLVMPFKLTHLPPGVEGATVFLQGLFADADGLSLGGPASMTWAVGH